MMMIWDCFRLRIGIGSRGTGIGTIGLDKMFIYILFVCYYIYIQVENSTRAIYIF